MGKYIGFFGSLASITALFFFGSESNSLIRSLAFIFGLIALIVSLFLEIKTYLRHKPLVFSREENNKYMKKIICNEGQVFVFAGDLSWVDDKCKEVLKKKGKDLFLCARYTSHTGKIIPDLKKAGVHIYTYKEEGYIPVTHFTIIRRGSPDEKIAIASIQDNHKREVRRVYEISKNDEDFSNRWITYVVNDIYHLVKQYEEK